MQCIFLANGINRQPASAFLLAANEKHILDTEVLWHPYPGIAEEDDSVWNWRRKVRLYGSDPGVEIWAIECDEATQGLMMLRSQGHRSWVASSQRIVYIDFLATAPWNRPSVQNPPRYRLVGSILLRYARVRSEELGLRGAVGLHSLPSSEAFYRKQGMVDWGQDAEYQNLRYFEWYQRTAEDDYEYES